MAERALTDVELERWLADDLAAARVAAATEADKTRLEELRTEHAAFLGTVDVAAEVRAIERRAARTKPEPKRLAVWWRWAMAGGALAAAAAALLVFSRRGPEVTREDDVITKGDGVGLVIHVATEGGSRQVATGDTVAPGAHIRFEIAASRRGYVAVVGIDGSGAATVYYPYGASQPAAIDPSIDRQLPGAIALDATPGDEKFFALYSEHPFAIEPLIPLVRSAGALPSGVSSALVVLHKK